MNTRIPARRLGQSALAFRPRATYGTTPSRSISLLPWKKAKGKKKAPKKGTIDPNDPLANPMLDRWFEKHNPKAMPQPPEPRTGTLSEHPTSLWKPEMEIPGYRDGMNPQEVQALKEVVEQRKKAVEAEREHALHALRLDPAPRARRRFERKMVIRDVSRQQRITKAIKIARTERQLLFRSQDLPISTKKLTRLMHLIAGKTIEEAMVQLRFSKKRIARDVLKGLQVARDEAIAKRGMGLGPASTPLTRHKQKQELKKLVHDAAIEAAAKAEQAGLNEEEKLWAVKDAKNRAKVEHIEKAQDEDPYMADGSNVRPWTKGGQLVELRDGTKKRVHDPTEMYIDQAWVGKGDESKSPEFRARGRINMLTHRSASKLFSLIIIIIISDRFSVLLKEEKTRLRISEEIQKKRDNRKLWLPLVDRPVTSQRQYCLW
ncbi:hypothetical protein K458DRAFT_387078 [Lentithecium fluviatile CBS 122367]|uniref:Ribosomal protein L22 n=1 Tax=Lentithecium fluviatile CBS 122367 TaxID=1168545 RepID=A0A6G1J6C9_9PLEO|nr:hypothetical protein K458DRAFT_387078 [Lentithecium fluviatile CBS 122367]